MAGFRTFLKAGHSPTLLASFIYFTYCCGVWVTNGAMAPFIQESLQLSPTQLGVMPRRPMRENSSKPSISDCSRAPAATTFWQ